MVNSLLSSKLNLYSLILLVKYKFNKDNVACGLMPFVLLYVSDIVSQDEMGDSVVNQTLCQESNPTAIAKID